MRLFCKMADGSEDASDTRFFQRQIKKGRLQFLSTAQSTPLLGVHSLKTRAKLLPPPVEQARAGRGVGGGEIASKHARRKRRGRGAEPEGEYESVLRKAATWDEEAESSARQLLPLKTKRGFVSRSTSGQDTAVEAEARESSEEETSHNGLAEEAEVEAVEGWSESGPKSTIELLAARQRKLQEKRALIATTSARLLENPEDNIGQLKTLHVLCSEQDPDVAITTRKLAMVSFMQVMKDIAPGYHIRQLEEAPKSAPKLSKEVRRLRGYEQGLVTGYQHYLNTLEETLHLGFPLSRHGTPPTKARKKGQRGVDALLGGGKLTEASMRGLASVGLNCLCELVIALPHFNFSTNILTVIVPYLDHKELSEACSAALSSVVESDAVGEISLEAVTLIARMVKARHYSVNTQALQPLLHLRLHEASPHSSEDKQESKTMRKDRLSKMSRRDRKRLKSTEKVTQQMMETRAEESSEKKRKLQTETLQQVFVTYFRILKHAPKSPLITPAMEGLARFAHLINVDFFADLMDVLSQLLASGALSTRNSLNCISTALQILSGQGEALNLDPRQFYVHLYRIVLELDHLGPSEVECLLVCLEKAFKRRRQVPVQRVMGFLKRLSIVNLQLLPSASLAVMATIRNLFHGYPRCVALLDSDTPTGVYQAEVEDPDICHAETTTMWELTVLSRHYHPTVVSYGQHLITGAPSASAGSLPLELSQSSFQELLHKHSLEEEDPFISTPLPKPHPAQKLAKKGKPYRYRDVSMGTAMNELVAKATDWVDT